MMTDADLIAKIEAFCRDHMMAETRFGREALGEASFLTSLRNGRSPSLKLTNKVLGFMASYNADHQAVPA